MNTFTLVIILMAYPEFQNGGLATAVVVPGFTTHQACLNAANKIALPKPTSRRVQQSNSVTCVATTI